MKKILFFMFVLILNTSTANATENQNPVYVQRKTADFDVGFGKVNKIRGQYVTPLFVNMMSGSENIFFWKLKTKCDLGVKVYLDAAAYDICNKKIEKKDLHSKLSQLKIVNESGSNSSVRFQIKAFDSNRKWINFKNISIAVPIS